LIVKVSPYPALFPKVKKVRNNDQKVYNGHKDTARCLSKKKRKIEDDKYDISNVVLTTEAKTIRSIKPIAQQTITVPEYKALNEEFYYTSEELNVRF